MQKTVLVPVADGTEELEAVAIIDILRRAGAAVTVASVSGNRQITASRGIVLVADALIEDCVEMEFHLVVLPGGIPGAEHLRDGGWQLPHQPGTGNRRRVRPGAGGTALRPGQAGGSSGPHGGIVFYTINGSTPTGAIHDQS